MSIGALLANGRLLVCVGAGGCGKTTAAAALALAAAQQGRHVLVLTADPARRLADALGVDALVDSPRRVAFEGKGELFAAMLETQHSFNALIERVASGPEHAQRLLTNPTYKAFSRTLARAHAYAVGESLYAALQEPRWDLIVVDTPPAQSALEILDAPSRLLRFLDARVLAWFLRDERVQRHGTRAAREIVERLAGQEVLRALLEFLSEMMTLRPGFIARSRELRDVLRQDTTHFLLVTTPRPDQLRTAAGILDELGARGLAPSAVVFNRAYVHEPGAPEQALRPASPSSEHRTHLQARLDQLRRGLLQANSRLTAAIDEFCATLEPRVPSVRVPELDVELAHFEALLRWASLATK